MKIRNWMTTPAVTVKPLDTVAHARSILEKHRVNQLPVVLDGHLIGIVTDRDLRDAFPSVLDLSGSARSRERRTYTQPEEIPVEWTMTTNPITLGPDDSMESAARIMRRDRIGAVPIVDGPTLIGMLTRSDVLDAFLGLAVLSAAAAVPEGGPPGHCTDEIRKDW